MVHLDVVRSCNAILVKTLPLVAVSVGGASGIWECAVCALAATYGNYGKGFRLYIVGRNKDATKKITSDSLKDVNRVCADIIQAEKETDATGGKVRVDFLVITQGYPLNRG